MIHRKIAMAGSATKRLALIALVPALLVFAMLGSSSADVETWRGEGWRTDFSRATVPLGEILSGGPPRG